MPALCGTAESSEPVDLHEAEKLARDLMDRHGLFEAGWRFRWGSAKRQIGSVRIRQQRDRRTGQTIETKTLTLSRPLVRANSEAEVRDTILHEIAHALAGPANGHNETWKRICRRIGAKPQRLAGEGVNGIKPRYVVVCGRCNRELGRRHRRIGPDRLKRSYCRACGPASTGQVRLHDSMEDPHSLA